MQFQKICKRLLLENIISEGGNVRVEYNGTEVGADKIDITKYDRKKLVDDLTKSLQLVSKEFQKKTKTKLLHSDMLKNLPGSGQLLFDLSKIEDAELEQHKPTFGDLDIFVPIQVMPQLYMFLQNSVDTTFYKMKYLGAKKLKAESLQNKKPKQINSIWEYDATNSKKVEGAPDSFKIQIDLVSVAMGAEGPAEFEHFSRSAPLEDLRVGVKGLFHKYILRAIVKIMTMMKSFSIITPGSYSKYVEASPKNEKELKEFLASKAFKLSTSADKLEGKAALNTFSILYGVRNKYSPVLKYDGKPLVIDGKTVYREISPDESTKIGDIGGIYKYIFGGEPTEEEKEKLKSYTGIISLLKEKATKEQNIKIFNLLATLLFSNEEDDSGAAQELYRDDPESDKKYKMAALNEFVKQFPELKTQLKEINKRADIYYAGYGRKT